MNWTELWRFETANYAVVLSVAPEDMDPADSFEFPEDIEAVRSGAVDWFVARMTVYKAGVELASDYLGGCAYTNAKDFCTGDGRNGYFRDMVREAVSEARNTLAKLCG